MGGSLEAKIKKLQAFYWSDSDPDGRGFVNLADAYRRDGDSLEALRILRDGLRRHPGLASGHVVRGWVYAGLGDFSDAEGAFRAALDLDAGNVSALRGLGDVLKAMGKPEEALEAFRSLKPLDPLDGGLEGDMEELQALIQATSDRMEQAPATEEPERPRVWENPEAAAEELNWEAAALQADQSKPQEAEEAPGETEVGFLATDPDQAPRSPLPRDDALVTRTMGDIFLRQGLLEEAEGVYQELLTRSPGDEGLRAKLEEVRARLRGEWVSPSPDRFGGPAGGSGTDRIVSIQELLADPVVSIEALAPDRILLIDELSPDLIVPVEALAPSASQGDPTLDAFEAWLDRLP